MNFQDYTSLLVDSSETYVCNAFLCCWHGLYTKTPDLVGCESSTLCLCVNCGNKACKDFNSSGPQYLTMQANHCLLVKPSTCFKAQSQFCCCFNACAMPCDDDVPSMIALCGLVLYPKFGFAKKFSEIPHKPIVTGKPSAPEDEDSYHQETNDYEDENDSSYPIPNTETPPDEVVSMQPISKKDEEE